MEKTIIARWESRGGKHWVELWADPLGCGYSANGAGGNLGAVTPGEAFDTIERRVQAGEFLPDRAKTPMQRVR